MLIRFNCPACGGSHSFDMPETTIHMTCSKTHKVMSVRVTQGGDVKTQLLDSGGGDEGKKDAEE